jgi:transposase
MSRLADATDGVIGVDTHRDTLAAAATDPVGGLLAQTSVSADGAGYRCLFDFARAQVPGRRCWAVEGAGSYGAGLAAFLQARGERVVEVGRPKRPARRTGAKRDALDAVRAAREALAHDHRLHRGVVATGKRCGCCWPPATAPVWPRSAPPISSRR